MYACPKFQLIWRTSDFVTKLAQKNMNGKHFEKINIKFKKRIEQCMPEPNFSQFRELQFLGQNLPKNLFRGNTRTNAT